MIIHDLKQGTPEWLEWRRQHVCASDIPVLMGESDFDTPIGIFKKKLGQAPEKESNFAMQRGTDTEPRVRALYSLENDVDVPAVLAQHDELPFLGASLDGYNAEFENGAGLIVEIKYPGKEKHQMAVEGKIPECYYGQVQFQLEVAGAKYCDYVSYNGLEIAVVRVERDEAYIAKMIMVAVSFWANVRDGIAPALTEKDALELSDEDSKKVFRQWRELRLKQMQLEEIFDEIKSQLDATTVQVNQTRELIASLMSHPKVVCEGVRAATVKRKNGPVLQVTFEESA